MTVESVELVSRAFSAFNHRDEVELLSLCHPDIEWIPMRSSAHGRVYRGHDGVREALADVGAEFEELRNDPRRWLDLGERVVVTGRLVAKERRGGLRIDIPGARGCASCASGRSSTCAPSRTRRPRSASHESANRLLRRGDLAHLR
jgi:ketosteroid isomerase-like protein